jgi:hypothetical protein
MACSGTALALTDFQNISCGFKNFSLTILGVDENIALKRVSKKYGWRMEWFHLAQGRDQ